MHLDSGVSIGTALTMLGWIASRIEAGAPLRLRLSTLLDGAVPIAGFVLIGALSGEPIFAGGIVLILCIAFAAADYCKRVAFDEPVLVADFIATADILRHPRLCLIFPRPFLLGSTIAAAGLGIAALFELSPATSTAPWCSGAAMALAAISVAWLVANPLLGSVARVMRRLDLSGEPQRDAQRIGAFAMLIAYGLLARADRAHLQAAAAPRPLRKTSLSLVSATPVVLVQCESFFDARRLHGGIAKDLLPAYDDCRARALQWGRFSVPALGANTVRTEFAALTGLPAEATGFDRFNPYHRFAKVPIASLAWRLKSEGYRTICIHPFNRTFYGRDQVFSKLGFDELLGEEAFAGATRANTYVKDVEVAKLAADLLRENGSRTFVFAITMENHGPWSRPSGSTRDLAPGLPEVPDSEALRSYLSGVASADAMIEMLAGTLRDRGDNGLLAFYGDHLPNLPGAFAHLGFASRRSDYLLWRPTGGQGVRQDLAAHELSDAIWRIHCAQSAAAKHGEFATSTRSREPAAVAAT